MERLKKYWYYRYPYQICLKVDDLPRDIIGKRFRIIDEKVNFITNKKGINLLNSLNIEYELIDNVKKNIKSLLSRRLIGFISLAIIVFLMFFSNYYIRKIEFENKYYYNQEVYEYLENNLNRIGNIYLVNKSLNELSISLRNKFNYYAFIGIIKEGGVLKIKIVPSEEVVKNKEKTNLGLYASKNAYITHIKIRKGTSKVIFNQMVKKDQILIEGENVDGDIIGRTIDIEYLTIDKQIKRNVYTGNYVQDRFFKIFNYTNEVKKEPFSNYYIDNKMLFELGFIKIYENIYYEKKEQIDIINIDLLVSNIKVFYEKEFYKTPRLKEEKIIDIQVLEVNEDEEKYYLKIITTKLENIVQG